MLPEVVVQRGTGEGGVHVRPADERGDEQVDRLPPKVRLHQENVLHQEPDQVGDRYQEHAEADKGEVPLPVIDPFTLGHVGHSRAPGNRCRTHNALLSG